jgi:RsiW-degrading membrane proteinase PrsW (M82 family)
MRLVQLFTSFFENFNVISLGIAVLFGAVWTACFRPPLFRKLWLWTIFLYGAAITFLAVVLVQRPVLAWMEHIMGPSGHGEHHEAALLSVLPVLLVSGLIQEGAKMVPAVTYWQMEKRKISPVLGLQIGAVAGAGFGILEAMWTYNALFASGWTLEQVQINGVVELFVFWESMFTVAMHVTTGALSGFGLAKGWGWLFYLLAALVHAGLYVIVALIHGQVIPHIYGDLTLTVYIEVIMVILIIVGERTAKRDEKEEQDEKD